MVLTKASWLEKLKNNKKQKNMLYLCLLNKTKLFFLISFGFLLFILSGNNIYTKYICFDDLQYIVL
jgi:hypothetical protein